MSGLDRIQQVLALHRQGRIADAEAGYRRLLAERPRDAQLWYLLGTLLAQAGRWAEAVAPLRTAIGLKAGYVDALTVMARVCEQLGDLEQAEGLWRKVAAIQPESAAPWANLGEMWAAAGHGERALAVFDERLATHAHDLTAITGKAKTLGALGRYREAFDLVAPLVAAENRDPEAGRLYADMCLQLGRPEEGLAHAESLLADPGLEPLARKRLAFSAGRLADRLQLWDRAFGHFERANRLDEGYGKRDGQLDMMRRILGWWDRERHHALPDTGMDSELPVFIVGMPRSGTSLTEQILDSHPQVHGAGELNALADIARGFVTGTGMPYPECLGGISSGEMRRAAGAHLKSLRQRAPGAARVIDKMPHNFLYLGLIARLFPRARIIHCRRHPVDTCLSEFFQNFNEILSFTTDLESLGRHYAGYRALMDHWAGILDLAVMEVSYEELVSGQESVTRAMLEFLGLPWDDACLSFHRNRRVVRTASMHQVRNPIYRGSVERWRRYETHLQPLLGILASEGIAVDA